MAEDEAGGAQEEGSGSWRRGWAGLGALVATLFLILLVVMVAFSNRARDQALAWERHTYNVMLLTRSVDGTMARAEATLARFVLDEDPQTGRLYYSQWRQAGYQIARLQQVLRGDREQLAQVEQLKRLYRERGAEFAGAATKAVQKEESGGVPLFYQAGLSPTGPALRTVLDRISDDERTKLSKRMAQTRRFDEQADKLTEWLGWFGLLIGFGAIILGFLAYRAITERLIARADADSEANRALALEEAVEDRTRELLDANERLRAEAAERAAAEEKLRQARRWTRSASLRAASLTISTTCWRLLSAGSILPGASCEGPSATSNIIWTMPWRVRTAPRR
jgi:CHASE3 domain sensor protein